MKQVTSFQPVKSHDHHIMAIVIAEDAKALAEDAEALAEDAEALRLGGLSA
jgi:hypothetical protein